ILRTVELASGAKADRPSKTDGAKAGRAEVAGRTIKIAKTVREEGELELSGLSDLDVHGLHSPKFQNAHTRDAHRIKALVRLAGVDADSTLFHELLGNSEEFEEVVDVDALKTDDLVEMASKVKRAIEKRAQVREKDAESAEARR